MRSSAPGWHSRRRADQPDRRPHRFPPAASACGRCWSDVGRPCRRRRRPEHHQLAAIIEFIHTSTLLHDDVVDESDLRRGRSTANALWGNAPSVLVGDFLYSRSFQLMVELDLDAGHADPGRHHQPHRRGRSAAAAARPHPDTDQAAYLRVIERQDRGAVRRRHPPGARWPAAPARPCSSSCTDYGMALGYAFQIADDVLDYSAKCRGAGQEPGRRPGRRQGHACRCITRCSTARPSRLRLVRHAIEGGGRGVFCRRCWRHASSRAARSRRRVATPRRRAGSQSTRFRCFPLPISRKRCYNYRTLQFGENTEYSPSGFAGRRRASRKKCRGVAQPGRALSSGGRGRRFESSLPDQPFKQNAQVIQSFGRSFLRPCTMRAIGATAQPLTPGGRCKMCVARAELCKGVHLIEHSFSRRRSSMRLFSL